MPSKPLKEQEPGKRTYKLGKEQNGGRISNTDRKYIEDNWDKKTPAQIQLQMKHRTLTQILKEIERAKKLAEGAEGLKKTEKATKGKGRTDTPEDRLRRSSSWPKWNKQFTPEEMDQFIARYTEFDAQFQDMTPTEEMQIQHMIMAEIQLDRLLIKIKAGHLKVEKMEEQVAKLMAKDDFDMDRIQMLEAQMDTIRANEVVLAKQQKDHQDFIKDTLKSLKSTRDQRLKVVENSATNFPALIKYLAEKGIQEIIGEEIGRQALAAKLEHNRLSKKIKYDDGEIDRPILNADTIDLEDDEDEEQEEIPGENSAEDEELGRSENENLATSGEEEGQE